MQLKTILNRVQKFKSFVYKSVRWVGNEAAPELEVEVAERANGKPVCLGCGHHRPGYDRLAKRRFEFVPLWGIKVFLVYAPRRVECPSCGIRVEQMPWAMGETATDQSLWLVSGELGQAALLEGDGGSLPNLLGKRIPLRGDGG